jgi:hypothetical protein
VSGRDIRYRIHVRRSAEQVDRHQSAGARRDRVLDALGIDVEGVEIDVREHFPRPHDPDGLGRREEREGRGDDFIARLHSQSPKAYH